jgi:outer membrane protein assembly factor BamB/plastocyanin
MAALAVLAVGAGTARAQTPAGCAPPAAGGDWPLYGGTFDNHREQTAEKTISADNVGTLGVTWKVAMPDTGVIQSTPTVADGCVFTGTDLGHVYAFNADTGAKVWERMLHGGGGNFAVGAGIIGAPVLADGKVYVAATQDGKSLVAALDQAAGNVVWQNIINADPGAGADASPVPFGDGLLFQSYQGDESGPASNPGFVIMDATDGRVLVETRIIPKADFDGPNKDRGGSITATTAYDAASKTFYAVSGNPANGHQNPITNSFLKIDGDPASPNFGKILASRRGDSESYPVPQDVDSPTCTHDLQWPAGPLSCVHTDMDFLASPNLWTASNGHLMAGALQKSGVYHAVDTTTMTETWKATLGASCLGCNLASTATDANAIYVVVTGGNLYALDKETGLPKWAVPGNGGTEFHGVTVANGVVYVENDFGALNAYRAADGVPLLVHPFAQDTNTVNQDAGNSSGIAVARNTVFVSTKDSATSTLFAFKLGAGGGGGGGLPPTPAPPGGVPSGTGQVVSGPGAATAGYLTPVVVMQHGGTLTYTNLGDISHHDVDSVDNGPDGSPLFYSDFADLGESVPVIGVDKLAAGQYRFKCSLHVGMQGTLVVQ